MNTLGGPKNPKLFNRQTREPSSLSHQLIRQLTFLNNSAKLFDEGNAWEANRLATTIRVLVHQVPNRPNSHCLLSLLGIKYDILYIDTGLYRDRLDKALSAYAAKFGQKIAGFRYGECGLVEIAPNSDGTFGWIAPLTENRFHSADPKSAAMLPPQKFSDWWGRPLVESSTQKTFSRWDLINIMANQDGGAHVDPTVDKDYVDLCVDHLGVFASHGTEPYDINEDASTFPVVKNDVAAASVRQIAFELALSIYRFLDANPAVLNGSSAPPMYQPVPSAEFKFPFPFPILMGSDSQAAPLPMADEVLSASGRSDPAQEMRRRLADGYSWNVKRPK